MSGKVHCFFELTRHEIESDPLFVEAGERSNPRARHLFTKMTSEIELRESLDQVAALALEFGGLLMECGATARRVEEIATQVAVDLGAELVDLRVGYASISITLAKNSVALSRMRRVGSLGVNQDLHHSLLATAGRIKDEGIGGAQVRAELDHIVRNSSRHPDWVVATAAGIACAAFGRLLGVDWSGIGPIFIATALSQVVRHANSPFIV